MAEATDGLPTWQSVRRRRDISSTSKLVWRTIERICLKRGIAKVGLRWLAADIGESKSGTHRAIGQLVLAQLLTVESGDKFGRATYKLTGFDCPTGGTPAVPRAGQECPNGGTGVSHGRDTIVPTVGHVPHDRHDSDTTDTGARGARAERRDTSFEMFWTAYPRKVGKVSAAKAWARAKIGAAWPEVMKALERQKSSHQWTKDGGQYVPHPSTWINQRRWEDEAPSDDEANLPWVQRRYLPG